MYRTAPKEKIVEVTVKLTQDEIKEALLTLLRKKYPTMPASVVMTYNTKNCSSMINWEIDKGIPLSFTWVEKVKE